MPKSAPQMRVALASMASNTGASLPGEDAMMRSTSEVRRSRASASSSALPGAMRESARCSRAPRLIPIAAHRR